MAPRLDAVVVQRIKDALTQPGILIDRKYIQQVAANFNTTEQTIYDHKRRIVEGRGFLPPSGGPERVITPEVEMAINILLERMPWYYQDEIMEFLYEVYDIEVRQATISKVLKRIKITRKRLRVEAAQRNPLLRQEWRDTLHTFIASQLIFIDETGSDERTGDRIYGYSSKGVAAVVQRWLKRKIRVSALAGYTIDGFLACVTFTGGGTGDIFEDFIIEDILPLCSPYPGPRSVIVMDNASIHHSQQDRIIQLARAKGVWIRFLPPYSPDFNPIEESFNDLKSFIRRWYRKKNTHFYNYQGFLEWAIKEVGTGAVAAKRARAHFRNAEVRGVPAG
jgi:transposase